MINSNFKLDLLKKEELAYCLTSPTFMAQFFKITG